MPQVGLWKVLVRRWPRTSKPSYGRICGSDSSICVRFPRIFSIFDQQDWVMGQVGVFADDKLSWDLKWKRPIFVYHEVMVCDILLAIQDVTLSPIHNM